MTLVLDLDETLVHATRNPTDHYDFVIELTVDRRHTTFYATKRPHVDEFLSRLHPYFEIVIFTASRQEYADRIIDHMDIYPWVDKRFFRDDCIELDGGRFVKNLQLVRDNLSKIILVDDSPIAISKNPENVVAIDAFHGDQTDCKLLDLVPFLLGLRKVRDVRMVLSCRLLLRRTFYEYASEVSKHGINSGNAEPASMTLSRRLGCVHDGPT